MIKRFLAITAIVFVPGLFLARDSMAAIAPTTGCCVMTATNTCKVNQIEANCKSPNQFLSGIPDCRQNGLEIPACKVGRIISPSVAENPNVPTPKKTAPLTFTPNVPIPGLFDEKNIPIDETFFGRYVSSFYIFFAGVAGILAVVVMMWGGFHYITSAGNPQKMKQGQEIISNAVIGLILVLTSYVLLRTINPNLLSLNLTSLSYVPQILQTQRYCEAQGANAVSAAAAQGKTCGGEVDYTDENGVQKKCISLRIDDQNLRDQEYACFPVRKVDKKTGEITLTFEALPATKICDDNKYTPDKLCNYTQNIFRYQDQLQGACKAAVVAGGKDGQCLYTPFFSCRSETARISCNAGEDRNTPCWSKGKPRESSHEIFYPLTGSFITDRKIVTAVCRELDLSNPPIEYIDGICCRQNDKSKIFCSDTACADHEVEVECGQYNGDTTKKFWTIFGPVPKCNEDQTDRQRCCAPIFMQYTKTEIIQ